MLLLSLTVTRRVSLMEQELLTLPEHLSSASGFQWGSCYSIFSLLCNVFFRSLFVLLAIVLPVLLRFTDFDYPFGIFKLFLPISCIVCKLVRVIYMSCTCCNFVQVITCTRKLYMLLLEQSKNTGYNMYKSSLYML